MLDGVRAISTWIQSWATPELGLWGVFGSALLSATVLPGSSEVVLVALITAYPDMAWPGFWSALAGNLIGALLTYAMGWAGREGFERFQRVRWSLDQRQAERLTRYGPAALVLSFVPLAGDALVLAAGWLKLPLPTSLLWIAVGKAARYLVVVLGMQGLMSLG